jgi:small subunit ribosomal protein S2
MKKRKMVHSWPFLKERLQVDRQRAKLEKNLGSISDMSRLPAALFVVDIKAEHIKKEAQN